MLLAEDAQPQAPSTTTTSTGAAEPGTETRPQGGMLEFMLPIILILAVMYLIVLRPQQKKQKAERKNREDLLKNLNKSDHVVTIGRMVGVVTSVTADEVVLKVDEKNDVRIRFKREAVSDVVTDANKDGPEGKKLDENPEANR
jgi:preprotein translocase subunit YajC